MCSSNWSWSCILKFQIIWTSQYLSTMSTERYKKRTLTLHSQILWCWILLSAILLMLQSLLSVTQIILLMLQSLLLTTEIILSVLQSLLSVTEIILLMFLSIQSNWTLNWTEIIRVQIKLWYKNNLSILI